MRKNSRIFQTNNLTKSKLIRILTVQLQSLLFICAQNNLHMKKIFGNLLFAAALTIAFTGCDKSDDDGDDITGPSAGAGGSAEVSAYVRNHSGRLIPAARIFIKYGATSFPGEDSTLYDAAYTAGISGHGLGHSHIGGLHQGAYWLYSVGYDSTAAAVVAGDNDVVLETETDIEELNISVE